MKYVNMVIERANNLDVQAYLSMINSVKDIDYVEPDEYDLREELENNIGVPVKTFEEVKEDSRVGMGNGIIKRSKDVPKFKVKHTPYYSPIGKKVLVDTSIDVTDINDKDLEKELSEIVCKYLKVDNFLIAIDTNGGRYKLFIYEKKGNNQFKVNPVRDFRFTSNSKIMEVFNPLSCAESVDEEFIIELVKWLKFIKVGSILL